MESESDMADLLDDEATRARKFDDKEKKLLAL